MTQGPCGRWFAQLVACLRRERERWRIRFTCWWLRRRLLKHPGLRSALNAEGAELHSRFQSLSVNRANQLRLQLGQILRPAQLQSLLLTHLASGQPSAALNGWVQETRCDAPGLLEAPAAYLPEEVVHDAPEFRILLYRRSRGGGAERAQRLVIGFTSNANAVSMSAPCFLHVLGPFDADVALVIRPRPRHDPYMPMLRPVCTALQRGLPLKAYSRVVTLGYSAGGFPAAVAAVLLDADTGVSVGGRPFQASSGLDRSLERLSNNHQAVVCTTRQQLRLRLLFCCAAGFASDVEGVRLSLAQARRWSLGQISLEGRAYGACRSHNLLVELQRRGFSLTSVLAELLFPEDQALLRSSRGGRIACHALVSPPQAVTLPPDQVTEELGAARS